jgi:hypothetical protein
MLAVRSLYADVAFLLIEKGADVDLQDKTGRTALHWVAASEGPVDADAAEACHATILQLLAAGAHVRVSSCCCCRVSFTFTCGLVLSILLTARTLLLHSHLWSLDQPPVVHQRRLCACVTSEGSESHTATRPCTRVR